MSLGEDTSRLVFIVDKDTRKVVEQIAKEKNKSLSSVTAEILGSAMKERLRNEKRQYFKNKNML